jgi:Xaa-Pro aminopeptidase
VGAGPHAAVLHYRTGEDVEAGYESIPEPSFVLIDGAPEYLGWASDLTRTYARGDKWTPEMEEVHGIVYRIQTKFMNEHYNEGAPWADINRQIMVDLTAELKEAGFLVGEMEELMQKNLYQVFMPHGLGHPVGRW